MTRNFDINTATPQEVLVMKVYRIQIRNFGAVAWRMYDKKEYSETDAITLVATLNRVDPFHYFRKVRIR